MIVDIMLSATMGFAFGTLAMRTTGFTWKGSLVCGTVIALTALTFFEPIMEWIVYGRLN